MTVGQSLPDAEITMRTRSSDLPIPPMTFKVYDRKVEAIEEVTTPAGTFTCYKISSKSEVKTIISVKINSIDWISEGVGTVQSESYDSCSKLVSKMVLSRLEQ